MPNHFHLLITPAESTTLEKAVQLVKGGFSHEFHKQRETRMEVWQVGFHDWTIRDGQDYSAKVRYIHMNPVEARLVEQSQEWPFGSACGKFILDPAPTKFATLASGAKALN
jgi:putative transposase